MVDCLQGIMKMGVKVMSHANMLLWAMDHPPLAKMYVILTLQADAFKEVVH
jgi:hypothetical protein